MKISIGDKVMVSDRNPNHLGYGVTAYAGWQGRVTHMFDNGGLQMDCGTRTLIISRTTKMLVEDISGSWVLVKHKVGSQNCFMNLINSITPG